MFAKTLYCNCILTSLNFDFLLVPSSNLLHLLITIITLIFENTKLFKLHYILQNFCASLSPPSYVIEVQSEAENDWIVELSKYSPRYRSFCSFFPERILRLQELNTPTLSSLYLLFFPRLSIDLFKGILYAEFK